MSDVVYWLYQREPLSRLNPVRSDRQPRWVVEADQLPAALAAMHQSGVADLEVRTGDGRPPVHAELSTRYLTTDEFCGFHVFEAAVSLAGEELVRTRYAVAGCPCAETPHRSDMRCVVST